MTAVFALRSVPDDGSTDLVGGAVFADAAGALAAGALAAGAEELPVSRRRPRGVRRSCFATPRFGGRAGAPVPVSAVSALKGRGLPATSPQDRDRHQGGKGKGDHHRAARRQGARREGLG